MRADLQVLRGDPDDVELAALVAVLGAVLSAAGRSPSAEVLRPGRAWGDPARALHLPARPGSTRWRTAAA